MSGQLSPDRNFYWDGARWVSAVSPDGAWRWDGQAWQPSGTPRRPGGTGRIVVLVALAAAVALVVTGAGVFAFARIIVDQQQNLQSSLSPACGAGGLPGSPVTEGETVCGRRVGLSITSVDCVSSRTLPSDLVAEHIAPSASAWTPTDVGMDIGGCELVAQQGEIVAIDSTSDEPSGMTLIADFAAVDSTGSVGLRLACAQDASCIDIALYPDGTYELDEGDRSGNWKTLKSGALVFSRVRPHVESRLILRFVDGVASVYLNGFEITHVTPDLTQQPGFIGFYADDGDGSQSEHVQLRRMYAFAS